MGYYRGDGGNYYRGDYYRGDPFLGAIIGSVGKKLVGKAAKWIAGRTVGARVAGRVAEQLPAVGVGIGLEQARRSFVPGMPALPALPAGLPAAPTGSMPWGAKRSYRKMNPLNPKALRRALRRAEGFEKFAKKTVNALYKTVDGRRVRTYKKKAG